MSPTRHCLRHGAAAPALAQTTAKATFAGGCFWCVEGDFDKVQGVLSTTSGYIGGTVPNPSYEQVSSKTKRSAPAAPLLCFGVTSYPPSDSNRRAKINQASLAPIGTLSSCVASSSAPPITYTRCGRPRVRQS